MANIRFFAATKLENGSLFSLIGKTVDNCFFIQCAYLWLFIANSVNLPKCLWFLKKVMFTVTNYSWSQRWKNSCSSATLVSRHYIHTYKGNRKGNQDSFFLPQWFEENLAICSNFCSSSNFVKCIANVQWKIYRSLLCN